MRIYTKKLRLWQVILASLGVFSLNRLLKMQKAQEINIWGRYDDERRYYNK